MAKKEKVKEQRKGSPVRVLVRIVGVILCIVLALLLTVNVIIAVKGYTSPDTPPSVGGITPMVVLTGSMDDGSEGCIRAGDLIFARKVDAATLKEGDVISFMEGSSAVTHRVVSVTTLENGEREFTTKGDANNVEDSRTVSQSAIIGRYIGRVGYLGNVLLYIKEPLGMLIVVGIPVLLFIVLTAIDSRYARRKGKKEDKTIDELQAEIERLRALTADKPADVEPEAVEAAPEVIEAAPEAIEAAPEAIEAEPEAIEAEPEAVEAEEQPAQ